jgi:hypothetical protein
MDMKTVMEMGLDEQMWAGDTLASLRPLKDINQPDLLVTKQCPREMFLPLRAPFLLGEESARELRCSDRALKMVQWEELLEDRMVASVFRFVRFYDWWYGRVKDFEHGIGYD